MKKYLRAALLFSISLSACAQQAKHPSYKLPDGKIVQADQLDSVNNSWGGRGYLMKHEKSDPGVIYISPMTDEFLKKQDEEKAKLNALLNKPAPDFTLKDLTGKQWRLTELKGKTVVLNFWFTTCPACIQEMPELNQLAGSYKNHPVIFLALGRDDAIAIKRFLKVRPFAYTHLQNADSVGDLYQVNSYPTSIVIDPKGIIRFVQVGGEDIKDRIATAINKTYIN
ncbi:redoxin domain-containing protein [Mucilaginibacter phyllosphaerae]